jgi:hypothetical protein
MVSWQVEDYFGHSLAALDGWGEEDEAAQDLHCPLLSIMVLVLIVLDESHGS